MAEGPLPTGTVTFVFTDVEESTRLARHLGDRFPALLEGHARLLRTAFEAGGGTVVRTEGDGFFVAFPSAPDALAAAVAAQRAVAGHGWPEDGELRVIGIHTGEGALGGDDYIGIDVHRAARIAAAGHGGQILLSEPTRSLVADSLPAGVSLRDLGGHVLKDFEAERLFQVAIEGLRSEFPPLRSLGGAPGNLPTALASFIGREREVAALRGLISDGSRLVTLTGPGGSGKTRLALRVAADLAPVFAHGAYFVDLTSTTDPGLLVPAIADTLGLMENPRRPLIETLLDELRDRHLLLILDNFEQIADAGPVVERVLREAPGVRALVTSRAPLRGEGEHQFPVPPLALPDPRHVAGLDVVLASEAVNLFVARATAVDPSFQATADIAPVIAEICARLDGLPLAIELAASRVKVLTPQQILDRLGERFRLLATAAPGVPERQRTLRGAIGWSYDLLTTGERRLFEQLSVFRGGATLEAVEAVCVPPGDTDLLDGLSALVDQSLLRRMDTEEVGARFVMLETIREYAAERLDDSGDREGGAARHAAFFLARAEEAAPHLTGMDGPAWMARLGADHDNFRAALRSSVAGGDLDTALRLGGALWRFWHLRANFTEARSWLEKLTGRPARAVGAEARVADLTGLGGIAYWQGDYPAAEAAYAEALEIARALGHAGTIAEAVLNMSYMPALRGDLQASRRLQEEALQRYEALGDTAQVALIRSYLGYMSLMEGDLDRARDLLADCLADAVASGDLFQLSVAYHMMGQLERLSGNPEEASGHYRRSIESYLPFEDHAGLIEPVEALGSVASAAGDHRRAVLLVAAMETARQRLGGGHRSGSCPATCSARPDAHSATPRSTASWTRDAP